MAYLLVSEDICPKLPLSALNEANVCTHTVFREVLCKQVTDVCV